MNADSFSKKWGEKKIKRKVSDNYIFVYNEKSLMNWLYVNKKLYINNKDLNLIIKYKNMESNIKKFKYKNGIN